MDKLKDIIYGLAIGDALGVPVEFKNRKYLEKFPVRGMIGNGTYKQPEGTWSDDTSLTLCLLDGLDFKNHIIDKERIANNMINWYENSEFTATNNRFDVGFTTAKAINNIELGFDPYTCGPSDSRSNGNGALMRISPLTIFLKDYRINERFEIVKNIVSITHGNEMNVVGCHFYIEFMLQILNNLGKDKMDILDRTIKIMNDFYNDSEYDNAYINYHRIFNKDIFKKTLLGYDKDIIKSSGFIVDSLEASIFCFVTEKNYEKSVLKAVNLGEDTDTIGAITGSMSGLYYGYEDIPKNWINSLKNKELINKIIKNKSF